MRRGQLFLNGEGRLLVAEVMNTTNAIERMRGLLWRPPLRGGQGLLIAPCNSVHTVGMGYAIDLVFLDRDLKVMKLVENLLPWRLAACRTASKTLELPAGSLRGMAVYRGDVLEWRGQ